MASAASRRRRCRVRRAAEALLALALSCATIAHAAHAQEAARHDVTFILGADLDGAGYFTAAAAYFRAHARSGEEIVLGQHSLAGVREYLAQPALHGDAPWGTIRLVAHGSQWYGLRVPIFDGEAADATLAAMESASSSGAFPPLGSAQGDAQTRVVVESCGIARRPRLMQSISALLFNKDIHPVIEASREYVAFRAWTDRGEPHSERVELPYAALVSTRSITDASSAADTRKRLRALWSAEAGKSPPDDLVLHEVPVEVRLPLARAAASGHRSDLKGPLYDLGLRPEQFDWITQGKQRVGKTHIVTLAPVTVDWVLAQEP